MTHPSAKRTSVDMLSGSLADKMIFFALPMAASSILQQLFNATDLAVVGRFASSKAMAAVGSNAAVINVIIGLFMGLSVGANVVISSLIGMQHKERIKEAVHTIITVALLAGVLLSVLGILLSAPILRLMGAPLEVMDLAILYLRIYFLAMPAIMIFNYGSAILRSKGDSTRPLIALTLSGILNVILNLILVVGFSLHVIGVATATVLSNILSASLTLYFLMTEEEVFRLDLRKLCIRKEYLLRMINIGLPAGIQGTVFSLSNVVIQSTVNSFGADAIAGATASQNFDFVSYCIINSFAQTAVTFTSQNYSAKKYDRCKKIFRISMSCAMGFSMTAIATMFLLRHQLIGLFTQDPAVISFAMIRVYNTFLFHYLLSTYEVSGGCLRGMNHSLLPALISLVGTVGVRLLYVFTYLPHHRSFAVLFRVYPISWAFTGVCMLTAYFLVRRKLLKEKALT